jgi:MFS family permease
MIEDATSILPGPQNKSKGAHPVWFGVLILPYGVIQGYLTVTLAYFYRNAGMTVEQIAGLVSLILVPNIIKFLWGPLVDLTFTVKKWHVVSTVLIAFGILLLGLVPAKVSSIPLLGAIILIAFVAVSFEGLAVSSLMAYDTPPEKMGLAGGYYNTGSVGGVGIGGGGALFIYQYLGSQAIVAAIVAGLCICCCFALWFVNQPERVSGTEKAATKMVILLKDLWSVLKARAGVLGLFLSLLPFGTGAAGSLFAAMAKDWHASIGAVDLATGFLSGIITAAGCFIAGFICDRINRRLSYVLFGISQAVCALGMAFCPHTQAYYIFWTLAYAFANGFAYAAFSAFVLEVIGKTAAATKYNTYAGISNIPIYAMVVVDGWANTRWGATGTLVIEAICAGIGAALFLGVKVLIGAAKISVDTAEALV